MLDRFSNLFLVVIAFGLCSSPQQKQQQKQQQQKFGYYY